MTEDYRDGFTFVPSPLQDDAVRAQLQDAIVSNDGMRVRAILEAADPALLRLPRYYGVLVPTDDGMTTIMVDQHGHRLGAGDVIDAGVPIDMLNITYGPKEMTVTFNDQQWTRPYRSSPTAQ